MAEPESVDDFLAWVGVDYFDAIAAITEWKERNGRMRGKRGRPLGPWTEQRREHLLH